MIDVATRAIASNVLVQQLSRFSTLGSDTQTMLREMSWDFVTYAPGQHLLREGGKPTACSLLISGYVFRHKIVGDGGRQILAICVPGDVIDAQQVLLQEADHNVQAITETQVARFPGGELRRLVDRDPSVAVALWRYSLIEGSISREWMASLGRRSALTRTAHLLCEMAVRLELAGVGRREEFGLPMTQEQLGDVLGLTSVHVNRTLMVLEGQELISRTKRSVTICDWQRLCAAGDFSVSYLHLPDQALAPMEALNTT